MKKIDTKSVMIGMLLGACIIFALGASAGDKANIGRYQITSPDESGVCFVIDTTSGQVWRRHNSSRGRSYGSPSQWSK